MGFCWRLPTLPEANISNATDFLKAWNRNISFRPALKANIFSGGFHLLFVSGFRECYFHGISSWWFFTNPFEKYHRQNGFTFPNFSGWKPLNVWSFTVMYFPSKWWTPPKRTPFPSILHPPLQDSRELWGEPASGLPLLKTGWGKYEGLEAWDLKTNPAWQHGKSSSSWFEPKELMENDWKKSCGTQPFFFLRGCCVWCFDRFIGCCVFFSPHFVFLCKKNRIECFFFGGRLYKRPPRVRVDWAYGELAEKIGSK